MSGKTEARNRLLMFIDRDAATEQGTTPEDAISDAIHEAILNQPALRTCLFPGCMRQFDVMSCMAGDPPSRPEWDGKGWVSLSTASIVAGGGHVCPDHKDIVTAHLPGRIQLPNGRWGANCACGWMPPPQRYYPLLRVLWEEHLLEETGTLPAAPPLTDPEHRVPLAEHTEGTLTELYDRLWDAEADYQECRDTARACSLAYTVAVPALLGVKTSLEALRQRITTDSRDWSADKLDAWLWAVLVGWNCENTDPGHVHDDIDCAGDQGLWNMAKKHEIPTDQTIRASHLRWWVANAIKAAGQIEAQKAGE